MLEIPAHSDILLEGKPSERTLTVRGPTPITLTFRRDISELLSIVAPVELQIGETRLSIRENFQGHAKEFEKFLKIAVGASSYNYHSYWKPYRKRNIELRNRYRRVNYEKGRVDTAMEYQRWKQSEIDLILAKDRPTDLELALILGRSVQAIQVKRAKYLAERKGAESVFHFENICFD